MKSKMMYPICLLACLLSTALWAQRITIFFEDFENRPQDFWTVSGGSGFQFGTNAVSPKRPSSGQGFVATNFTGNYANNSNTRLISPYIQLPTGLPNILFEVMSSMITEPNADYGKIQIQTRSTSTWTDISPIFTSDGSGVYSRFQADISQYAGQEIRISFLFISDGSVNAAGWWLDDVSVYSGLNQLIFPESFENGTLGSANGSWLTGVPQNGIIAPHGSKVMGTVISGNYGNRINHTLESPPFIIPARSQQPRVRFDYLARFEPRSDIAFLKLKKSDNTWVVIDSFQNTNAAFSNYVIDLSEYAGQRVSLGFQIITDGSVNDLGFYFDNLELLTTGVSCLTATTTIQKTDISCFGNANGSATVTVSGGTPPYTYQWGNGGTTATISGLAAGLYPVTISGGGVCTKTDSVRIVEPTAINPVLTKNPPSCSNPNNGNIQLTPTGGTPPYAYRWSNGSTASNRTNLGGGTYAFTITDANNCTASSSVTFTSTPSVSATISGNTTVPIGGTTVMTASGGGTYLWSTGATTPSIMVGAGNYSVTVSNGICSAVATRTITVQSPLSGDTLNVACSADSFYLPILLTRDVLSANGGGLIHIFFDATKIRPTGFVRLGRIVPSASGYFIDTTNSVASIGIFLTGAAGITGVVGDTLAYVAFKIQPNFKQPNARLMLQTDVTLEWLNGANQQTFTLKYIGLTGSNLRLDIVKTPVGTPWILRNGVSVRYGNGCTATSSDKIVALNTAGISMSEVGFPKMVITPMIRQVAGLPQIGGQDAHLAFLISLRNAAYRPTITSLIAADVDGSGAITISDVTQIQRRSVGDLRGFVRQNGTNAAHYVIFNKKDLTTEGYQISANYPLANGNQAHVGLVPKMDTCQNLLVIQASCDTIKEEWVAVLLGDIDNSYLTVGQIERLGVSVHINFCKAQWLGNNEWLIPIQADETTTALDLVIQDFSPNLQWLGVVAADGTTINGRLMKIENTVYISSFSTTTSGELANRNLLFIKVRSMNPSLTTGLFGTITAWHNGKAATVELTERNATCKTIANKNAATISVAPTLAHEAIWIQNPSDKPHNLLIVNALGQTVSHAVAQANDVTEVDITAFSNGLYFVKNTQGGEVVRFVKQ